jgi:hypothetical protein
VEWESTAAVGIEHMVIAHVAMGQNIVAKRLTAAKAGAVAEHHPGMRPEDGDVVGDGLGIRRADADVDQRDARVVFPEKVIGRHLRQARQFLASVGATSPSGVTWLPGSTKAM